MKIFVVGREGQVARALREAVRAAGVELAAAGRPDCDVRDVASVAHTVARCRPDVVINAAAYTQVDRAESDEEAAFAVNAQGAANVAQVCAAHDLPLIHLSTDYVFDGGKAAPYDETDSVAPINVYGRSKCEGERLAAAACPKHLILRTSWVYGPHGSNFFLTMLRLAATRPALSVVDDQFGAPTYAPDLADALIALAARLPDAAAPIPWGVYHATNAGETNWFGFAQAIFAHARSQGWPAAELTPIGAADYPAAARRPRNSRLDCTKLRTAFGLALPDWRSGLARAIARVAEDRTASGAGR